MDFVKISLFITAHLLFFACHQDGTKSGYNKQNLLVTHDTLILQVDSVSNYEPTDLQLHGRHLLSINTVTLDIYKFDVLTGRQLPTVKFEAFGPDGVGYKLAAYDYVAEDSIYVIPNHEKVLLRMNSQGEKLEEISITGENLDNIILVGKCSVHLTVKNGFAYIGALLDMGIATRGGEASIYPAAVKVNIASGEAVSVMPYPEEYDKVVNSFFFDFSRTFGPEEVEYFTFAALPDIFTRNEEGVVKYSRPSAYLQQGILIKEMDTSYEEFVLSDSYGFIAYDPYKELFYRGAMRAFTFEQFKEYDNFSGGMWDKQPVLSVFDKNLNLLSEYTLPREQYMINEYFVDEQGLWLSMDHPLSPDLDEDEMKFRCFSFNCSS